MAKYLQTKITKYLEKKSPGQSGLDLHTAGPTGLNLFAANKEQKVEKTRSGSKEVIDIENISDKSDDSIIFVSDGVEDQMINAALNNSLIDLTKDTLPQTKR